MSDMGERLVTANRLRDGVPVYFTGSGGWSTRLADACVVPPAEASTLLAAAEAGSPPRPVVAPYVIEAVSTGDELRPTSLRERIRARGPSV